MTGILIVYHGSRAAIAAETFQQVVDVVRQQAPTLCIETAAMEFHEKTIPKGLESLLAQGSTEIQVVPYFLFDGIHLQQDIPEMIHVFQQQHPHLSIIIKPSLGADPRLAEIILDRIGVEGK